MTTLAEGREAQLAMCWIKAEDDKDTIDWKLKWQAQVLAISLNEHPYYCFLLMLEHGYIEPHQSLENHPYGWEICFYLWVDDGRDEWTKTYDGVKVILSYEQAA